VSLFISRLATTVIAFLNETSLMLLQVTGTAETQTSISNYLRQHDAFLFTGSEGLDGFT